MLTHFSLFTGIGGIDLASEWAGFTTVGQVEIDDYCNKVLEYHWPEVPRWRDVRDVTVETFEERTGIAPGTLALLSGGFPCQPVSCAGKRKGDTDERWLWDEMLRVICEIRPRWVVAENVRGLLSAQAISDGRKLFGRILRDLAQNGYRVGWLCYGAGDVGAPHKRERVFIVAYSWAGIGNKYVAYTPQHLFNRPRQTGQAGRGEFADGGDVADPDVMHREQCRPSGRMGWEGEPDQGDGRGQGPTQSGMGRNFDEFPNGMDGYRQKGVINNANAEETRSGKVLPALREENGAEAIGHRWPAGWWPTPTVCGNYNRKGISETSGDGLATAVNIWPAGPGEQHPWEPPRIATGVKDRVAKLKALGNAVVPAQAYPIFKTIAEVENS